ncbi:monovalent cation/H(+) antiporter subunit G [Aquibium sp. ELW1220]|uniref:monovalent cation/H(+) antiporter subunit G n=1 Tax=Aquibium sp. ELW1220 TaxID=2976766 RepID=UPI0025B097BC|nr:monovalent cation/H(+) antiporter subunit G [Aquibium sp. ELW1220]MDN2579134.1 monovalent cation/H(+) antiporter subunit G [Aquibium sp. ELW1220]
MIVVSVLLKLLGVGFLCIAGIGVMRLADPFQRMHAATKAGTLGAGLVILGSVISHGATDATVMGLLTIVFLLLTVPVAGHLLGRASYMSGARLSLRGDDALAGVLERSDRSLDERLAWLPAGTGAHGADAAQLRPAPSPKRHDLPAPRPAPVVSLPAIETVRFAVIQGQVPAVAARACAIARRLRSDLSAHVIIDTAAFECAADPASARQLIRERASEAIRDMRACMEGSGGEAALNYDEGDPERLLASSEPGRVLLVLPCEGWFHHQVEVRRDQTTWDPDGLLRLPMVHRGPVLFVSPDAPVPGQGTIVVRDRGEAHLPALLEWALAGDLWQASHIVHVGRGAADRREEVEAIARRFGCSFESRAVNTDDCSIPDDIRRPRAVILGQAPRPLRTSWFGSHWRRRISPDVPCEVLLMEAPG